jgi:catechol 2,3-dioxygenase
MPESPDGASDHGVSEALCLRDSDENGVELYWDRPREEWPRNAECGPAMPPRAMDLRRLLKASEMDSNASDDEIVLP